jgi:putative ABC transport system permease protein
MGRTGESLRGRCSSVLAEAGRDSLHAVRSLARTPLFTVLAVLTLAIGIGASTAAFSVLNSVLLRPLPVQAQQELAVLWLEAADRGADRLPVGYHEMESYREETRAFRGLAGVSYQGTTEQVLVDGSEAVSVGATWVTGDLLPLLGVRPVLGRTLLPEDDHPGAARVMVIDEGLWRRHFGSDPGVVGRVLLWGGEPHTVVGVLPAGFAYPAGAEVWTPVLPAFPGTLEVGAHPASVMPFELVGRLRPGVALDAAHAEYSAWRAAGDVERPAALRGMEPVALPFHEVVVGGARTPLRVVLAAVFLLLLVACVNVANLLLIRGSGRVHEMAVRSALGAGHGRLARQLLAESGVVAAAGGVLGVLFALLAVRALVALAPPELPRLESITMEPEVLLFSVAVTVAAALLAGVLPAVVGAGSDVAQRLRGGGRAATRGRGGRRLRESLVVAQVALALVVVVGAGLLVRSLAVIQGLEMGFAAERMLVVRTTHAPATFADRATQLAAQQEMLERVAALPGAAAVAAVPQRPFSGTGGWTAMYSAEGQTPDEQGRNPWVNFEVVGPEYFHTLEMPLLRGRAFAAADREGAPPVAIVSQAVARQSWPGQDPIGRRVKLGPLDGPGEWHTVVGVVGETRYRELLEPQPSLYLPVRQFQGPVPMNLAVRTRVPPSSLLPQIRAELREVHPDLLVVSAAPVRELLAEPLARPRFTAAVLAGFALLTLLLGAVGIYGVLAATVRQRTREIGIRLALGARVGTLRRQVLGEGMRLAALGCLLGVALALLGTRSLHELLFGVPAHDPVTFVLVILVILAAAAVACVFPARRATRVDPMEALRVE